MRRLAGAKGAGKPPIDRPRSGSNADVLPRLETRRSARRDARRGECAGLPAQRGRESPLSIDRAQEVTPTFSPGWKQEDPRDATRGGVNAPACRRKGGGKAPYRS